MIYGAAHAKAHTAEMPPTCSVYVCADVKIHTLFKAKSAFFLISVQLNTTETVK
jgi:putative component of membrane protein insertase Oxa1/YidC/SpoIIIJ protein YidD